MGNPFVHVELNTDDLEAARKFYGKLFDWNLLDLQMPAGIYTLVEPGHGVGGAMQLKMMTNAPTAWLPYVEVENVKRSIAKARKLGAKVVSDFMDLGESGSAAIIVDPAGAMLGLWAPAKPPASAKPAKKAPAKAAGKKAAGKVAGAAAKAAKTTTRAAKKVAATAKKVARKAPR